MSTIVQAGDYVIDHMDGGIRRQVQSIEGSTLHMTDGGVMGIDEVNDHDIVGESEYLRFDRS